MVLTFDNLGEAAEMQSGAWPAAPTPDRHPSVTDALPALLRQLDDLGLPATFCVEAENCERYPAAVLDIAEHGHELGLHGWRHERWSELRPEQEVALTEHSLEAFGDLGLRIAGFRPPGGAINPGTLELLAQHGLSWCSPAGRRAGVDLRTGVAIVPFRWPLVDALYLFGPLSRLRVEHGLPSACIAPEIAGRRLWEELTRAQDLAAATLILHPVLLVDRLVRNAIFALLRSLAEARDAGALRVVTAGMLAGDLRTVGVPLP